MIARLPAPRSGMCGRSRHEMSDGAERVSRASVGAPHHRCVPGPAPRAADGDREPSGAAPGRGPHRRLLPRTRRPGSPGAARPRYLSQVLPSAGRHGLLGGPHPRPPATGDPRLAFTAPSIAVLASACDGRPGTWAGPATASRRSPPTAASRTSRPSTQPSAVPSGARPGLPAPADGRRRRHGLGLPPAALRLSPRRDGHAGPAHLGRTRHHRRDGPPAR